MAKQNPNQQKTYVASVRTALSGPEDGITRKLPDSYATGSVGEVLSYMTDKKQLTQDEAPTARSLESEMSKRYSIVVNGRAVNPEDKVVDLFQKKAHKGVEYLALDMEVASVQTGGLVLRLV
jgi:hypothetical protein